MSGQLRLTGADWLAAMRLEYQRQPAAEPDLHTAKDFIRLMTDDIYRWLGPDRYEEFRQDLVAQWQARHPADA